MRLTAAVQVTKDALGVLAEGALGIGMRTFEEEDNRAGAAEEDPWGQRRE